MSALAASFPTALKKQAKWDRIGDSGIPSLLVHPNWESTTPAPVVVWMHGRTVNKELDPGRYLRLMRAGIGTCSIDLPGHGERADATLQNADRTLEIIEQMEQELDTVVAELRSMGVFNMDRLGIGGMSAGGMATIRRLCRSHSFRCASVEACSGSWSHQESRPMFRGIPLDQIRQLSPVENLGDWQEIPFQAIHARLDQWVAFEGQAAFVDALRDRYQDPSHVDFIVYEETGAPDEHAGFGRMAADAKDRQRDFFRRWLVEETTLPTQATEQVHG